jgi:hypothetical protein
MVKRVASSVMWFLAVSAGFEYLSLITGVPSAIGLPIAVGVAAFFGVDPLHRIWNRRATPVPTGRSRAISTRQALRPQG